MAPLSGISAVYPGETVAFPGGVVGQTITHPHSTMESPGPETPP